MFENFAAQSIELVNRERARAGLRRLVEHPLLNRVALAHSADMGRNHFYGHINRQGHGPAERIAAAGYEAIASAENIARGQSDPETVVQGWMNSPGHRANILTSDFTEIGAGHYATGVSRDGHFWTHLFAIPDPARGRDHSRYPAEVVELLNHRRVQKGSTPLAAHSALQRAAQAQAVEMARRGRRAFQQSARVDLAALAQQAGYRYRRIIAQAAAGGNQGTPEQVIDAWFGSEFRDQLLDTGILILVWVMPTLRRMSCATTGWRRWRRLHRTNGTTQRTQI
jgi:uncharacterized protein YkwD